MMSKPQIPPFQHYFAPILEQLDKLGGSATIQELEEHVADAMGLSNAQTSMLQAPERGNQTAVGYRMAWARTYLKKMGYIDNSERGVWSLTAKGRDADILNPKEIVQAVQAGYAQDGNDSEAPIELDEDEAVTPGQPDWRAELFQMLHALPPDAFERLCQRLLRECGFVEVEVTGRSGDGGIDGSGILRLQRLVTVNVLFQSKRYNASNPVGSAQIRDFRGAMQGRTDKGLLITTGRFTADAVKEATRDGAPTIDLIDGDQLVDLLKDLKLGVETELVERVTVKREWFEQI